MAVARRAGAAGVFFRPCAVWCAIAWTESIGLTPLDSGTLGSGDFDAAIRDYYLTNPIARASTLMAELSANAKMRVTDKIAAE